MSDTFERARVTRVDGGFILKPQNPNACPLLVQLFHGHAEDIDTVVDTPLAELLETIRRVARDEGLSVVICGNLKTEPVLLLKQRSEPPQEPIRMIFERWIAF